MNSGTLQLILINIPVGTSSVVRSANLAVESIEFGAQSKSISELTFGTEMNPRDKSTSDHFKTPPLVPKSKHSTHTSETRMTIAVVRRSLRGRAQMY